MQPFRDRNVLAVDAAPAATGLSWWTVRDDLPVRRSLINWGIIVPSTKKLSSPAYRIAWTEAKIEEWIALQGAQPTDVVCERLFGFGVNPATGMDTLVAGVHQIARRWHAGWWTYQPRQWRAHVGGADKRETALILQRYLDWPVERLPPMTEIGMNGYDSCGLGLHHVNQIRLGLDGPKPKKAFPKDARLSKTRRTDYRR